jgi:hypothetical protein
MTVLHWPVLTAWEGWTDEFHPVMRYYQIVRNFGGLAK